MPLHGSPRGTVLRQHHDATHHRHRVPAEALLRDFTNQAGLHIQRPEQALDGSQLGLDLEQSKCLLLPVPSQDVYGATLAIARERDLHLYGPAEPLEHAHDLPYEPRMPLIEEAIKPRALPGGAHFEACVEGGEAALHISQPQAIDLAGLEKDDLPATDARPP